MLGFPYEMDSWHRELVTRQLSFSSDLVVDREILHYVFRVEFALKP